MISKAYYLAVNKLITNKTQKIFSKLMDINIP